MIYSFITTLYLSISVIICVWAIKLQDDYWNSCFPHPQQWTGSFRKVAGVFVPFCIFSSFHRTRCIVDPEEININ